MEFKEIDKIPSDYHCTCEYCTKFFVSEIRNENGSYISARQREGYGTLEKTNKHVCPGHWQGYAFIISKLTQPNDIVLDPTCGSGTAMVEASKQGRKGIGIELEFASIARDNISQWPNAIVIEGDARDEIKKLQIKADLVINGPPYNNNSDPPERKNIKTKTNATFGYSQDKSLANLRDKEYFEQMAYLFRQCYDKMAPKSNLVLIIKDPIRNKRPYLLHHLMAKRLEETGKFKVTKVFLHRHHPSTLFMNTYKKIHPEVDIVVPFYQTMVCLERI